MRILEVTPYEPPASGWVNRVKLLRRVIEERGGRCEILDIGPNRKIQRAGCVPVYSGWDFLSKLWSYSRRKYVIHTHINGQYFRGLLLALAAVSIGRSHRSRCVTTFHAGTDQANVQGLIGLLLFPLFASIFLLSHSVVCNSESVRQMLTRRYTNEKKVRAIPAFSKQYLEFRKVELPQSMENFIVAHERLVSTYFCFRDGFFYDVVNAAIAQLENQPLQIGFVVVGTGDEEEEYREELRKYRITDRVHLAGDLGHDEFMTLISRSHVHLRTARSDGVSATVLESLSLGIPVLAADNGTRPESTVLYKADDPDDLSKKLLAMLQDPTRQARMVKRPQIVDTAKTEVDLLCGM